MLFDRWQHCRQMGNTARNIFDLSTMAEPNNESFIHEIHTLISNTAYLASIIEQNKTMMVCDIELSTQSIRLITGLENIFGLLKNFLNNFELTVIPTLIRSACSKQKSLFACMDLLNASFQLIQQANTSNVSDVHLTKSMT